jgi:hypothetical protein
VLLAELTAATTLARLALLMAARGFLATGSATTFSFPSLPGLASLCRWAMWAERSREER